MTLEELWQAALSDIELNISRANFVTWFKNSQLLEKRSDGTATIACHNNFAKEWLENKYQKFILRALRNLDQDIRSIEFIIQNQAIKAAKRRPEPRLIVSLDTQLNLPDINVDRETNLNPKYAFGNFIVGSANELAHAAAQSVAESPGLKYNPLFIYGGTGLGKTHLLQAVGNALRLHDPKKKIKYVTSERFTDDLVSAIRKQAVDEFKANFRHLDLLLIDDIQFFAGKEKTQEEFFHTFNALHERNKQIIFTSDRPPKAIPAIEERLRSRFEGGMIVDIGYPDVETRMAILKTKSQEAGFLLEDNVLEFIANKIQRNIRELEGALNRVIFHAKMRGRQPTIPEAEAILAEILQHYTKVITAKQVIKTVSEFYDISDNDLIKKSRKKDVVKPRQIAMYLLREELKTSYPAIGEKFGNRDHTTVIHACEKIKTDLGRDQKLVQEINTIREKIFAN
ncbi:MAG: chromosomal replication initiator protein DnaA [Parcubacteria group bacterium]|nr:chromosomal replication initiator protein DnaA [Parcubacteria group bacterium]